MQPKNNTSAIERVDALIAHIGISQAAFARRCGVEPSNLNKRLSGEVKFTDYYFAKIARGFNVNFEWLRKVVWHPIAEGMTVYTARYTFASIGAELEIPRETIALCLGHSWADVTDHYIAYGTKRIDDAVRKIIDYVNSDKA